MKNEEFEKLKNRIAIQSIIKILGYSVGIILLLCILIDGIYNDSIANSLSNINRDMYIWCVENKMLLAGIMCFVIFAMVSFVVLRNVNNNLVEILSAMDEILKEPEKQVKLSNHLFMLESRLNNIRIDLISNQNKAKEEMQKKNDLIMYMAHDLKTPLTSIIGYLTLLTDEKEIPKNLQEKYLNIALKKALRVEDLTNQFFDITRYNLQSMPITKQKIDLAIQYVIQNAVKQKDENTAFILEEKDNELKLGANGIGLLMLVEYMQTFQTNQYEEVAIQLANGILEMQNEDGSYYHVYDYPTFQEKAEYRTTYYDGEATFALLKLYEYTKDEKYLQAAQKSMDYFVEKEYEQYRDQWIQYSVNEITKYIPNEAYFELGLRNMTQNYNEMLDDIYGSPTNLELLATGLEIYDRAIENKIDVSYFDKEKLTNMIKQVSEKQLNGCFYPEYAMYFNHPNEIVYAFFKRTASFKIRIDDVQHHINAYYTLLKNYAKIYSE